MSQIENEEFDIFISYNWDIKEQVVQLHNKLMESNIKVWRDDTSMRNNDSPLTEQLAKGIKNSKLFICCITKKYDDSKNCNLEINYAHSINKAIMVLMMEKIEVANLKPGIGIIIGSLARINCYRNPTNWFDVNFDEIKKSIESNLAVNKF